MATVEFDTAIHIDDEWRRWIAENPLLDSHPQGVSAQMLQADIPAEEVARELQQVSGSPYIAGAQRQRNRLAKHDWVLDNQRRLNRLPAPEIPPRHRLSRGDFLHYTASRPVIITGVMEDWPALSTWNLDHFQARPSPTSCGTTTAPPSTPEIQPFDDNDLPVAAVHLWSSPP